MPFTPFTFDDTVGRTEPGRPRVPEGYYLLECLGVKATPEDYEKTPGYIFDWKILEGAAGHGRSISQYNTVKAEAQFGLGMTLGALGLADLAHKLKNQAVGSWAQFDAIAKALSSKATGRKAVGLIADQAGARGTFSSIEQVQSADDWATVKDAAFGPRVSQQTNGAPVAVGAPAAPVQDLDKAIDALFQ